MKSIPEGEDCCDSLETSWVADTLDANFSKRELEGDFILTNLTVNSQGILEGGCVLDEGCEANEEESQRESLSKILRTHTLAGMCRAFEKRFSMLSPVGLRIGRLTRWLGGLGSLGLTSDKPFQVCPNPSG